MHLTKNRFFLLVSMLLASASTGHAMPIPDMSEPVPIARLVENVSRYIKTHPKNAEGYYTLARIHSIAFAQRQVQPAPYVTVIRGTSGQREDQVVGQPQKTIKAVPAGSPYGDKELPGVDNDEFLPRERPNAPISSEDLFHLRESVRYYIKATILAPKDDSYWLGLGWMLEQGAPYASRLGAPWNSTLQKRNAISSTEDKSRFGCLPPDL